MFRNSRVDYSSGLSYRTPNFRALSYFNQVISLHCLARDRTFQQQLRLRSDAATMWRTRSKIARRLKGSGQADQVSASCTRRYRCDQGDSYRKFTSIPVVVCRHPHEHPQAHRKQGYKSTYKSAACPINGAQGEKGSFTHENKVPSPIFGCLGEWRS